MAFYSTQRVTSTGTLVLLPISIEYFDRSEITVFFDDVLGDEGVDWNWVGSTDHTISFPTAVADGVEVMVVRTTDISAVRHIFVDGAAFLDETIDENYEQMLHIAQEARERASIAEMFDNLNMHGYNIFNLGMAVNPTDAVSLAQYQADALGAHTAKNQAIAAKDAAQTAQAAAELAQDYAEAAANSTQVVTVSNNIASVNTVAGNIANVNTVAGNSANVTTVAGKTTQITTVSDNITSVNTVATNQTSVNTVSTNVGNVNTVATDIAAVQTVANDLNEPVSEIETVAGSIANVNTVGNNITNVNAVAGNSSNINTVATNMSDVQNVSTNMSKVDTVSTNIASVNTCSTNIAAILDAPTQAAAAAASAAAAAASYDSFDDRYLGSKSIPPTLDNDGNALIQGALYYNNGTVVSGNKGMWVYDGAQWIQASAASQAILTVYKFIATAGQTTFSGADSEGKTLTYTPGSILVTLNGPVMTVPTDVTASSGTSIVLSSAAVVNDEVNVYAFSTFNVADTYSQAAADAKFLAKTGGTMTGTLAVNAAVHLGGTSGPRDVNICTNEVALIPDTGTLAFINLSDASGSNGGSYNLQIRGLINNGNQAAKLNSVNIETNNFLIGGYSVGLPDYASVYGNYAYHTWYQAPVHLFVVAQVGGPYMNDEGAYAGTSPSAYTQIFRYGDDINSNTKWNTVMFFIKAGAWFYVASEDQSGFYRSYPLS